MQQFLMPKLLFRKTSLLEERVSGDGEEGQSDILNFWPWRLGEHTCKGDLQVGSRVIIWPFSSLKH